MNMYELAKKSEKLAPRDGFMSPVWHMIMSAIENATDTVGATEGKEFQECARLTLESNLCFPNDLNKRELAWLKKNGVNW